MIYMTGRNLDADTVHRPRGVALYGISRVWYIRAGTFFSAEVWVYRSYYQGVGYLLGGAVYGGGRVLVLVIAVEKVGRLDAGRE